MNFENFKGMTFQNITVIQDGLEDEIVFETTDQRSFRMYHDQDCCESVWIESIDGDIKELIGDPVLLAEEVIETNEEESFDSYTWTFYKLATIKGFVTIRWNGYSNGYYSESVDLYEIKEKEEEKDETPAYPSPRVSAEIVICSRCQGSGMVQLENMCGLCGGSGEDVKIKSYNINELYPWVDEKRDKK